MQDPRAGAAEVPGRRGPARGHELDDARVIRGLDAGEARRPAPERSADFPPGRIARVQDAARAVRPLDRQRRRAVRLAIERRAPGHELPHVAGTFLDEDLDRARIAEAVPRGDRIGGMQCR